MMTSETLCSTLLSLADNVAKIQANAFGQEHRVIKGHATPEYKVSITIGANTLSIKRDDYDNVDTLVFNDNFRYLHQYHRLSVSIAEALYQSIKAFREKAPEGRWIDQYEFFRGCEKRITKGHVITVHFYRNGDVEIPPIDNTDIRGIYYLNNKEAS